MQTHLHILDTLTHTLTHTHTHTTAHTHISNGRYQSEIMAHYITNICAHPNTPRHTLTTNTHTQTHIPSILKRCN